MTTTIANSTDQSEALEPRTSGNKHGDIRLRIQWKLERSFRRNRDNGYEKPTAREPKNKRRVKVPPGRQERAYAPEESEGASGFSSAPILRRVVTGRNPLPARIRLLRSPQRTNRRSNSKEAEWFPGHQASTEEWRNHSKNGSWNGPDQAQASTLWPIWTKPISEWDPIDLWPICTNGKSPTAHAR